MQEAATLENPLRAGIRLERTAEPCAVVIFGASGDLAKKKLLPALYNLAAADLLPELHHQKRGRDGGEGPPGLVGTAFVGGIAVIVLLARLAHE
jgi:hypothetical protein